MKYIKKTIACLFREQKGFALVLVSAGMVVLLGFVALVTDIGMLALNKQKIANALDAAALAGAQELPVSAVQARAVAVNYALLNGCSPDSPLVTSYNGQQNSRLTIAATKEVNFIFARVLGIESGTVSVRSSAAVCGLTSYQGAAPLAVPNQSFDYNTLYKLKQGANDPDGSPLGPGTYGALSLGGPGADNYENNLKYGYDSILKVGDLIETETGNMSNPTRRAINYRIDLCHHAPQCTPGNYDPGCPRILIIPVYEPTVFNDGQIKTIRIVGFAAFLVDAVVPGQGNDNEIYGYFLKMAVEGDTSSNQVDYGLMGVKLIE
jgi:Flp pilus assembly protein TadG